MICEPHGIRRYIEEAKPILFNTEMVIALQENRKTRTRRVLKPQPQLVAPGAPGAEPYWRCTDDAVRGQLYGGGPFYPEECAKTAPYRLGDILYVRETWQFIPCLDCDPKGCGERPVVYEDADSVTEGCYIYRANYPEPERMYWHPSIHMPKQAARLFFRVSGVRVEQLQEITEEEMIREGVFIRPNERYEAAFRRLWDATIRPAELGIYGWEANPWVYVYELERMLLHEN